MLMFFNFVNKTDLQELTDRNELTALENLFNSAGEQVKFLFSILDKKELICIDKTGMHLDILNNY